MKLRNLNYRLANPEVCILRSAKNRAIKNGITFSIDFDDIQIPVICPILGIPLERRIGGYGGKDSSPSLDRIDPTKGYEKGNIWVVSQKANAMKSNATTEELKRFAEWVRKTYE